MRPSIDRLKRDMEELSLIGRNDEGGIDRAALSPANVEARSMVMGIMDELGLSIMVDAVGNIRGRKPGRNPSAPAVMTGSHLDSVPNGGNFDGPLGVLTPLEALRTMKDAGIEMEHPIEVVVFTGEEGSRFGKGTLGSSVMSGGLDIEEAYKLVDAQGITLQKALDAVEVRGKPQDVVLESEAVKSFVELHIEQGAKLEEAGIPIGIVEVISGLACFRVTATGRADHAGATPMNMRLDPLVAAAEMILAINRIAREDASGTLVATVGKLTVQPGAFNVVPAEVVFGIDVRDPSREVMGRAINEIKAAINRIASAHGVKVEVEELEKVMPTPLSPTIIETIAGSCDKLGIKAMRMYSGAIHDTSHMAEVTQAGMVFVPSAGGKSHSPLEFTPWEKIAVGLDVLFDVLLTLAGQVSR
ncbi:MAG: Zn-dependent hydrolase [Dehalococcoidia bacterium]